MNSRKVILLTRDTDTARIFYHFISKDHEVVKVIFEKPESKLNMVRRRVKKLGWWHVTGQIIFQLGCVPVLSLFSQKRIREIISGNGLNQTLIPPGKIERVNSVNDQSCANMVREVAPDVVVVHGTRIISSQLLNILPGKFVNMHAGITPDYRGVHGMYWALAKGDDEHAGVTIHRVDQGIDTGSVLFQEKINATPSDNFVTYPYLQMATGLPLLNKAISENGSVNSGTESISKGKLWYHPTIWQYLFPRRVSNKMK